MLNINIIPHEESFLGHDLHVDFEETGIKGPCSLYYFALDNSLLPQEETLAKAVRVLHLLLGRWHTMVASLEEGEETDLLYDIVDQSIGCIHVKRAGGQADLQAVAYDGCGGASPVLFDHKHMAGMAYSLWGKPARVPLAWFLAEIGRERDKIGAMAEAEAGKPAPPEDRPHVERFSAMGGEIYLDFEGETAIAVNGYHGGEEPIFRLIEPTGRMEEAMRRAEDFLREWFDSGQSLRRFE